MGGAANTRSNLPKVIPLPRSMAKVWRWLLEWPAGMLPCAPEQIQQAIGTHLMCRKTIAGQSYHNMVWFGCLSVPGRQTLGELTGKQEHCRGKP
jgi:hypothetical protein